MQIDNQNIPIDTTAKTPEITIMTHIFIAIASMCFVWMLFVSPAMSLVNHSNGIVKYIPIITVLLIFCVILPIIMFANGSYKNSISDDDNFIILKMVSVIGFILIMHGFLFWKSIKGPVNQTIMTWVLTLLLVANIAEAVYTQYVNKDKPEFDGISEVPKANLINPIIGIILIVALFVKLYKGHKFNILEKNGQLRLVSSLGPLFIISYTLWNLLFRIQLVENTSTFIFMCVSLLLPIITEFTGTGDWLQVRAYTLLFVMIMTFGVGYNQSSIMPFYNKLGYQPEEDAENPLTVVQKNKHVKMILLVLGFITAVMALVSSWIYH